MLAAAAAMFGVWLWEIIKWTIIILAVIAVFYIVVQQLGIQIPPFLIKIFWVVVAAGVGIVAIRFLFSL